MTSVYFFIGLINVILFLGLQLQLAGATPIGKQSDLNDDAAYLDEVRGILDDANLTDREKVSLIENDVVRMFVEAEKPWTK